VIYLRADEESRFRIAQATSPRRGRPHHRGRALVRFQEDFVLVDVKDIDLADVSSKQMVGVAACLIPSWSTTTPTAR